MIQIRLGYTDEQSYSVSLTVSDGTNQHTYVAENYITVLGQSSDILVVNGIAYAPYTTDMLRIFITVLPALVITK